MLKKPMFPSGEQTIFFVKHHYRDNGFLRKPYVSSICSIFSLCMELDALEKSTNNSVALRFKYELILKCYHKNRFFKS